MKRNIISFCAIALVGLSIGALSLSNRSSNTKQAEEATTKVKKHKSKKQSSKKDTKNEQSNTDTKDMAQESAQQDASASPQQNDQSSANTTQTQKQSTQVQQQKTQGQINKERGYDPNGHPLLPGQDHAAGSNPDGSADDWVKGQDEWLRQNGLINSDGSPTQKAKDIQAQTAAEASNSYTNP